ncbi:hypothetical protein BH20VER1_BH20VER1_24930 [soil metagenome]
MKIHLRQIPADGLHLEGEEDCPLAELTAEGVVCKGQLNYSLDVGVSEGALWANGSLQQLVELRCVSCLEPFLHTIEVTAFAVHTELGGPETIDLGPMVREDLLLNLPAYPHCDQHGGQVCRAAEILPPPSDAQTEEARKPDWSALDKLEL